MATFGDFVAATFVPEITRRLRNEMVEMIRRVADRESDPRVAQRLREIAGEFQRVKL